MNPNDQFSNVSPFQIPEQVRAMAEQSVSQVRDGYQRLKEAAETGNGTLEAVCASATKGAGDFTTKVIDIAKINTEAAFDFAQSLLSAKSLPEAFALVNAHAQKQFEILTAQSQDLAALTQKVATDTVEPIKAGAAKTFKTVV